MSVEHSISTGVAEGSGDGEGCGVLGEALGSGTVALGVADGAMTGSPTHPLRLSAASTATNAEPRRAVVAEIPMSTILSRRQSLRERNADNEAHSA